MIYILALWIFGFAKADTIYNTTNFVPLAYTRIVNNAAVTGLTVKVAVVNAQTNATLLSSTTMTESVAGSGAYNYNWAPNFTADTFCLVTYTVGSGIYKEYIYITNDGYGGRSQ